MSNASQRIGARLLGRQVKVLHREYDWVLDFGDGFTICVEGMWRLRSRQGVLLTDRDHHHQFGLPEPLDAAARANALLANGSVISFDLDPATADLRIGMSNDIVIEVLTTSSGYESWQAYQRQELVALGRGDGPQ
jgi:hypothetical protein